MKTILKKIQAALCATIILMACEKQDASLPKGTLQGTVHLMDEFGNLQNDHSGVNVTVAGNNPVKTVSTDSEGKFYIHNLSLGTYNFIFQKNGYQEQKVFSYPFIGGDIPTYFTVSVILSEISMTTLSNFSIGVKTDGTVDPEKFTELEIDLTSSPESSSEQPRYAVVYIHTASDVSYANYTKRINMGTDSHAVIKLDKLEAQTTYYAIAYPSPVNCSPYFDPGSETYYYTCYGTPVEIVSFFVE